MKKKSSSRLEQRRPRLGTAALVCVVLCAAIGPARANELPVDLPRGALVRVTAPATAGRPLVGTIAALDDRILTLQVSGRPDPVAVRRDAIARLERSMGHSRSRGRGALIGAGIGLGAGVLAGLLHGGDDANQWLAFSAGAYALMFGLGGAATGSLIGVAIPPGERWETVPPSGVRVSVGPRRGHGVAVSASLGW